MIETSYVSWVVYPTAKTCRKIYARIEFPLGNELLSFVRKDNGSWKVKKKYRWADFRRNILFWKYEEDGKSINYEKNGVHLS